MTTLTLHIDDMHCAACTRKISTVLESLSGIQDIRFNPVRRQVLIAHDRGLDSNRIIARIEDAGFHPELKTLNLDIKPQSRQLLLRLGVAGLALMQVMMAQGALYAGFFQGMDENIVRLLEYTALVFCIPVVCYCAMPFFRKGFGSLASGVNMDTPIALAIAIAFLVSLAATVSGGGETYYDSVAMFTFLMLAARYFDARLRLHIGMENSLLAALPKSVVRLPKVGPGKARPTAAARERVELSELSGGDTLWIGEGEQLPADGVLLDEEVTIDEALLSGESDWKHYVQGQAIYAGTFNRGAGFRMEVTKTVASSRLSEIEQISSEALAKKHSLASLADRVAGLFIPAIFLISAATVGLWWIIEPERAITAGLAVLIVSCPCALSLATPAALSAAMTRLRQHGLLIKTPRALEVAQNVGAMIFDKTGTLASPTLRIGGVQNLSPWTTAWCTQAASALQLHSSHPLASAFDCAPNVTASQVKAITGQGLEGVIDNRTIKIGTAEFCDMQHMQRKGPGKQVYLSVNNTPTAIFDLVERPRAQAAETLNRFRKQGIHLELLSGDKPANCRRIAEPLNLPFQASKSPEEKFRRMTLLKNRAHADKKFLMYVGDGMNDIPALAAADLSVATLETNELVKSKADAVLLTQRLSALQELLSIGNSSQRIIRQNLIWTVLYNLTAIPWAVSGTLPPWAAALGMSVSSIIVLLNSSRLLRAPSAVSTLNLSKSNLSTSKLSTSEGTHD